MATTTHAPYPPAPPGASEAARWEHTRLRRRLLDGTWRDDLEVRLQAHLGSVRRDSWGPIALSINPFRNISRELAVLYDVPPEVRHATAPGDAEIVAAAARYHGLWPLMQRVQALAIGCRDYLVRVDVTAAGSLALSPVAPDHVTAESSAADPSQPVLVRHWRLRELDPGKCDWYCDVVDARDPRAPSYRVESSRGDDVTAEAGIEGWPAAWLDASGLARSPYVAYHAQAPAGSLWEPYEGIELVEASLDLAVLHAMLVHTYRDASWPQRYGIDVELAAATIDDTGRAQAVASVVTDPASVAIFRRSADAETQPVLGQWAAGGDVEKMDAVLANMVARVAQDAGVPPSDVQRIGGTARSGAAISLTNEGKRQAQRRYAEIFRRSDEILLGRVASALSSVHRLPLASEGYEVVYREIPLSPEELAARREHVLQMRAAGLMGDAEAYRELHPGMSAAQAALAVAEIQQARPRVATGEQHGSE